MNVDFSKSIISFLSFKRRRFIHAARALANLAATVLGCFAAGLLGLALARRLSG